MSNGNNVYSLEEFICLLSQIIYFLLVDPAEVCLVSTAQVIVAPSDFDLFKLRPPLPNIGEAQSSGIFQVPMSNEINFECSS